jgi:hypothetical protein
VRLRFGRLSPPAKRCSLRSSRQAAVNPAGGIVACAGPEWSCGARRDAPSVAFHRESS